MGSKDTMETAVMEIVGAGNEVIFRKDEMTKHLAIRIENRQSKIFMMIERRYDKHYPLGLVHAVRETYYHFNKERKTNERT